MFAYTELKLGSTTEWRDRSKNNNHVNHGKDYVTHIATNLYDNPSKKISNQDSADAIKKILKTKKLFLIGFLRTGVKVVL